MKFDDIDWWSCALVIQQKEEQKRQLEETNDKVKMLQGAIGEGEKGTWCT